MNPESSGEIMTHITLAAVSAYGIEYLKTSGWFPWLTADSKTLNRLASILMAIVAAAGISGHYDPTTGGTLTIPPLMILAGGLWEAVKQFAMNQLIYDTAVSKEPIQVKVEHIAPSSLPGVKQ